MGGLLFLGLVITALAAFDYVALRWGVDSRTGFEGGHEPTGTLSVR